VNRRTYTNDSKRIIKRKRRKNRKINKKGIIGFIDKIWIGR
jgi:hypothetical protein